MQYQYGVNAEPKTQLILRGEEGKEILLSFETPAQKREFVRTMKGEGANAQPATNTSPPEAEEAFEPFEVSEEQMAALQEAWMLRYPTPEAEQTVDEGEQVAVEKPREINVTGKDHKNAVKYLQECWSKVFANIHAPKELDPSKSKDSTSYGVVVPMMVTNSRWWQEGVSVVNGKAQVQVELAKSEKILIHLDSQSTAVKQEIGYPAQGRKQVQQYDAAKMTLKALVESKLNERQGQAFEYGQVIFQDFGATLRHRRMNQPVCLEDWTIEDNPFDLGCIQVNLRFKLELDNAWKKLRGYGIKATLVPDNIFNLEVEGAEDWVVLHSMSGLKGKPLDLVAFSHAIGGAEINVRDGVIVPTSGTAKGKAFDITKLNSVVDKWRNQVAREITISFDYAKAEWEFVKAVDIAEGVYGTKGYDVISVQDVDSQTVRITAKIEAYVAEMPFNVEISLPEESSTLTQLTPEMVSVLTLQHQGVGELMVQLGSDKRQGIVSILAMFQGNYTEATPIVDIQDEQFLSSLQGFIKDGWNDQQVVKAYGKKYPKGVVMRTRNENVTEQFIDFQAIQAIATFIGGSGEGVTHTVAEFFRALPSYYQVAGADSLIHQLFSLTVKSTRAWFLSQLESKSLRKKLVSGLKGTAFGSKVRTLAISELSHVGNAPNCIPKVAVNPKDDILKEIAGNPFKRGKIPSRFLKEVVSETPDKVDEPKVEKQFDPYKLNGEIVSVFRTPMPMQGVCELVVTDKVGVGHLGLLMHIWAFFNEGDSDGDGIGLIPLFHYFDKLEVDTQSRWAQAMAMNAHPMGMYGYILCYGKSILDLPCAEFCSHSDAWSKKKILIEPGSAVEAKLVKKGVLPYIRSVPAKDWEGTVGQAGAHYRNGVSTTYNIAVVAVNQSLAAQYKIWNGGLEGEALEQAQRYLDLSLQFCAISWRLLYEGLGLAGISASADRWLSLFQLSGVANKFVEGPFGPKPVFGGSKIEKYLQKDLAQELVYLGEAGNGGFDHLEDARSIARMLQVASVTLKDARAIENPARKQKRYEEVSKNPTRFALAVIRRTQRLCSQGTDNSLGEKLESAAQDSGEEFGFEDVTSQSCLELYLNKKFWDASACEWQAQLLKTASAFTVLSMRLVANSKADADV